MYNIYKGDATFYDKAPFFSRLHSKNSNFSNIIYWNANEFIATMNIQYQYFCTFWEHLSMAWNR